MPEFEAISYCWEEVRKRDYSIHIDGKPPKITKNAFQTLVDYQPKREEI